MWIRTLGLILLVAALPSAATQDDLLAGWPAFSAPEQPARSLARCDEIRPMSAGLLHGHPQTHLTRHKITSC
jgi:hypothetical protein